MYKKVAYIITALVVTTVAANAALVTLASESFGTVDENPMADNSSNNDLNWINSGPGGSNASRLFTPDGGGCGYNTGAGWISIVDGSAISTTISLATLAGTEYDLGSGILDDATVYSLTWEHATETSVSSRISTFDVGVSSTGILAFQSGGNEDASQSLTGLTDTGTNTGGTFGSTADRRWTMTFTGTGLTTSDTITVLLGRNTSTSGFTFIEDVELTAIPEPATLGMVVAFGGGILFIRRKLMM